MILEGLLLPALEWTGSVIGTSGDIKQSLLSLGVLIIAAKLAEGAVPPAATERHHRLCVRRHPVGAGAGVGWDLVGTGDGSY